MPASMLGAARETSAAPTGSRPSGSSAARRAATVSARVAAVRSRSTYSSSLEKPSGMAGLKESRGIGWCPCEKASGRPARRAARRETLPSSRVPVVVVLGGHRQLGPAGRLEAAVVAAPGARGVVVEVAHRLEVTGAAVRTALDRAVGREHAGHRARQVLEEELPAHARVEVVPGELLVERSAAEVEVRVE